jgi:uncharacterized protein with NAD-binding domain and iron-sulfur cluster
MNVIGVGVVVVLLLLVDTAIIVDSFLITPTRSPYCSLSSNQASSSIFAETNVVVIGGGWAGFSVADSLSQSTIDDDMHITVLDASPRGPGGLAGGWKSPVVNRTVEGGIHGFWRDYKNTFAVIERVVGDLDSVLTPYTPSVLYSETGRVALAPVLGTEDKKQTTTNSVKTNPKLADIFNVLKSALLGTLNQQPKDTLQAVASLLPAPIDLAILSDFNETQLSVSDRVSALGLLPIWADFVPDDPNSWKRYDDTSAESVFRTAGVSNNLYQQLVSPLLHVLPMCPGYDCSAAAAISCFHVFALQSAGAFDVRWCRGTISDRIFNPWIQRLLVGGTVDLRGNAKVTKLTNNRDGKFSVTINEKETIECDAVVLAVGITAAKRLLTTCPPLSAVPSTSSWNELRGVTCVCCRLFFSGPALPRSIQDAMHDSPVAVCGPRIMPELAETGFCIYDLQRMQDEFRSDQRVSALEVDYFRADSLCDMTDAEVKDITLRALAKTLGIDRTKLMQDDESVVDVSVVRARNAVSHFNVGSASCTPNSVRLSTGIYVAGDWIDRTGHSSWSTEKSVVTGRQAAAALAQDFGVALPSEATRIVPAPMDTPQLLALRKVSKLPTAATSSARTSRFSWRMQ